MVTHKQITDFTEAEFLSFVEDICNDTYPSEKAHMAAVAEFERLSEHPSGSDLIYYPEEGSYEICPVCTWEDDPIQTEEPDYKGGANVMSLNEAREAFRQGRKVS